MHANPPWVKTGYGTQAASLALQLRAAGHEVAFSGPFCFSGAPTTWEGFPVLPGGQDPFGSDVLPGHYAFHRADLLITLCDVFMMDPNVLRGLNVAHWTPVDTDRPQGFGGPLSGMGAKDAEVLRGGGGVPIAMSRFGQRKLRQAQFSPVYYAPHSIDTQVFKPEADREAARATAGLSPENFVIGINAANKAGPRKAYPEQMVAFARFRKRHPEARLLIHGLLESKDGVNLRVIAENLGLLDGAVLFPDQYAYICGMMGADSIATWCGVLDVLSNATYGEGFGIPILEAQACGTPVVITNHSSMPELLGAGWKVAGDDHWVEGHNSWWRRPSQDAIVRAYEKAWQARENGEMPALREKARAFALRYDTHAVFQRYWQPILRDLDAHRVRIADAPARAALKPRKKRTGDERGDLLVIVPSRGRPENVKRLAAAIAETATAKTSIYFAFDDDDPTLEESCTAAQSGQAMFIHGPRKTLAAWTNEVASLFSVGYRYLASMGDDHVPRTPGWDSELLAVLDSRGGGFAYPNDMARSDIPEACVMSSEIVQALGWMANPACSHFWIDNTWADLGKGAGCITYLPDVVVEHVHPDVNPQAKADDTYRESATRISADQAAYERWRVERMAADVATVRKALGGRR